MFTKASALNANCYDCYYNIGFSYGQKKEYDKAEAAYKKAIEMKSDYADAYSGLSTIYNAQRKFDLAAEAASKATQFGGGGAAGPERADGQGADGPAQEVVPFHDRCRGDSRAAHRRPRSHRARSRSGRPRPFLDPSRRDFQDLLRGVCAGGLRRGADGFRRKQ